MHERPVHERVVDGVSEGHGRIAPHPALIEPARRHRRLSRHDVDGDRTCSFVPVVRARLTQMRKSHVFSVERPSKRSRPRSTAIHVSWTTSSALASFDDVVARDPHQRLLVASDEFDEGPLVTVEQLLQQLRVVHLDTISR